VHVAGDGEEAMALAPTLAHPPDLLLTDVVLPRLDGPRLAEALRARWPGLRAVFTSGYGEDRTLQADLPAGELLPKPFTFAELLGRVRAALDAGR